MAEQRNPFNQTAVRESALFLGLLLCGLLLLPVAIYAVGQQLFGNYGGYGYADFFGELTRKLRHADFYAWFLVLSPYLVWQILRVVRAGWRALA